MFSLLPWYVLGAHGREFKHIDGSICPPAVSHCNLRYPSGLGKGESQTQLQFIQVLCSLSHLFGISEKEGIPCSRLLLNMLWHILRTRPWAEWVWKQKHRLDSFLFRKFITYSFISMSPKQASAGGSLISSWKHREMCSLQVLRVKAGCILDTGHETQPLLS